MGKRDSDVIVTWVSALSPPAANALVYVEPILEVSVAALNLSERFSLWTSYVRERMGDVRGKDG